MRNLGSIVKLLLNFQHTHDTEGYIRDKASELDFNVDQDFLLYLKNSHGIDINPEEGKFSFELTCMVSLSLIRNISIYNAIVCKGFLTRIRFIDNRYIF